jgi:hypothetical protein
MAPKQVCEKSAQSMMCTLSQVRKIIQENQLNQAADLVRFREGFDPLVKENHAVRFEVHGSGM